MGFIKPGAGRFVLGSFPVLKLTPEHTTSLASHDVESWLTIAPDVIVGAGLAAGSESLVHIENADTVLELNLLIAKQSSVVAGSSRLAVQELIGKLRDIE